MTDNHEKLLIRIRALFSKTVEAGATEPEAMAAAEKARELERFDAARASLAPVLAAFSSREPEKARKAVCMSAVG